MLQIVFSDAFEKCFDPFIEKLEGAVRPMELVPSDLLKHSAELTLRKVFRVVRSVKSASMPLLDLEGPEKCAKTFFTDSFEKTSSDLSDHAVMAKQDLFYRVKTARQSETPAGAKIDGRAKNGKEPGETGSKLRGAQIRRRSGRSDQGVLRTSGQAASGGEKRRETLHLWVRQGLHVCAYVDSWEVGSKAAGGRRSHAVADEAGHCAGDQREEMTGR
jgi:hypothetical protein